MSRDEQTNWDCCEDYLSPKIFGSLASYLVLRLFIGNVKLGSEVLEMNKEMLSKH